MKNNLISISGKIHSGKNEIGNIIRFLDQCSQINEHNTNWENYVDWMRVDDLEYDNDYEIKKFAGKIKDIVWVNSLFADYKEKICKRCNAPYNIDECWSAKECSSPGFEGSNWIITDTRFSNEIKAIKNRDGICIKIERLLEKRFPEQFTEYFKTLNQEKAAYLRLSVDISVLQEQFLNWLKINNNKLWQSITHISETSLDNFTDWDYVITNNRSVEDLITQIKNLNLI